MRVTSLLVLALVFTGCVQDDNGDDAASATPRPSAAESVAATAGFYAEFVDAICGTLDRCCPANPAVAEACRGGLWPSEVPAWWFETGLVIFDAAQAAQCLADVRERMAAIACESDALQDAIDVLDRLEPCRRALSGRLAAGEHCEVEDPTDDGAYVATDAFCQHGLICVEGSCEPSGAEGTACRNDRDCDPPLVCRFASPEDPSGFCHPAAAPPPDRVLQPDGAPCDYDPGDCLSGFCDDRDEENPVCGPRPRRDLCAPGDIE